MNECGCEGTRLCLAHKLAYWRAGNLQVSPTATPSRRNHVGGRQRESANAWERSTPVDSRGMPQLGPDLTPLGAKAYAEKRQLIEARKREVHNR